MADRTLKALNRKIITRFSETKRKLRVCKFDELNVIDEVDKLYEKLDRNNRNSYLALYAGRYLQVLKLLCKDKDLIADKEDTIDSIAELYITGLLMVASPVTKYAYDNEVIRKRERAKEGVFAGKSATQKQEELDKAMRYWAAQTAFYTDIVHDEATVQAMQAAGIKRVVWHTQEDGKVCDECETLKGRIFKINEIPDTHPHCRCWVSPVD